MCTTWPILGSFHGGQCCLGWQEPPVAAPHAAQMRAITENDEVAMRPATYDYSVFCFFCLREPHLILNRKQKFNHALFFFSSHYSVFCFHYSVFCFFCLREPPLVLNRKQNHSLFYFSLTIILFSIFCFFCVREPHLALNRKQNHALHHRG